MTDTADGLDDFNWVKALQECSITTEFKRLRDHVEQCVAGIPEPDLGTIVFMDTEMGFAVEMDPGLEGVRPRSVKFAIETDHEIGVIESPSSRTRMLKLILNDEGKCRFRVDGEDREYLRWQVARLVLQPLLFG